MDGRRRHATPDSDGESELTDVEVGGVVAPPGGAGGVRAGEDECHRAAREARRRQRVLLGTSAVSNGRAAKKKTVRNKTVPHAVTDQAPALRDATTEVLAHLACISAPMAYGSIVHALQMSWNGRDPQTFPLQDDMPDNDLTCLAYHARQCLDNDAAAWLLSFRTMVSEFRLALTAQRSVLAAQPADVF